MTRATKSVVADIRWDLETEWRNLKSECNARGYRCSTLAEYRARRAMELATWNHWAEDVRAAVAD